MYLSYDNLWRQLDKYGLKKTDLISLTGMSSRTLSKLSKNESVSLDSLIRICEVLHCGIEDVMTVSETFLPTSLYDAYRHIARAEQDLENVTVSCVTYLEKEYLIYETKKIANKLTVIRCKNGAVEWEQMPFNRRLDGMPPGTSGPVFSVKPELRKNTVTVFVIAGAPGSIEGLDEGIFRSARHPGGTSEVHVMSMAAFKTFLPSGQKSIPQDPTKNADGADGAENPDENDRADKSIR